MKIKNFYQIHNWKFSTLFSIILSIQLSLLGLTLFANIGTHFPILREFVGFVYLTFVPGILVLRVLKLYKLDTIEAVLYSAGISITILMFLGFFINEVYPYFGIKKPLSFIPIVTTIYIVVFLLLIICYKTDWNHACNDFIELKDILNPRSCALCLIPFISIFGAYLVNVYGSNIVLLLLLIIIASIPLLIGFDKLLLEHLYPLTIFVISISLIYHSSLISNYLWGTDIHHEYYISKLTQNLGFWNYNKNEVGYSLLSINILYPIYSTVLGIDIRWVLKALIPFIFSLVPVGLYDILQIQTNKKIAFFSSFFFLSITPFYTIMLEVPRQQLADFFFILYILLMVSDHVNITSRRILSVAFVFSLIVSHYTLACIFIFSILFSWLILFVMKKYSTFQTYFFKNVLTNKEELTLNFTTLILVFTVFWYATVAGSSVFQMVTTIVHSIISTLSSGLLDKNTVESVNIMTMDVVSPLHLITKDLYILTQLFLAVGAFFVFYKKFDMKFRKDFFSFSMTFMFIIVFILVVPNSSRMIGITRLYSILLLLLSQFLPIGFIAITYTLLSKLNRMNKSTENFQDISFKCLSVFFFLFLLFSSGFMYQVANDHPQSISLDSKIIHPRLVYNDGDISGAKWLLKNIGDEKSLIYSEQSESPLLAEFVNSSRHYIYNSKTSFLPSQSYMFMTPLTHQYNEIEDCYFNMNGFLRKYFKFDDSTFYYKVFLPSDKIYDNGIIYIYK